MENLNKLSYTQYKINENTLEIPMDDIIQEYDDIKFASKPYLFEILYIGKYNKKSNEYTVYLGPLEKSSLPIIKATIPLEIIRTNKLIPSYDYSRELTDSELFIIRERVFRKISEINFARYNNYKTRRYFILCYGYMINKYKDDDALTKKEKGIQQFRLISKCPKKFKDKNYETTCFITDKINKIFDIKINSKRLPNIQDYREFKQLPKKFFIDKK